MASYYISSEFSKIIAKMVDNPKPKTEQDKALKKYIRLILILARKYVRAGVEYEDLISTGIVGLLEAVDKFEPERSDNFKTYAITRINGRMYEFFIKNTNTISIPTHISKARVYAEKMIRLLDQESYIFTKNLEVEEIIKVKEHEEEKNFSEYTRKELYVLKNRVETIAKHSRTTYEKLIDSAYLSMVTELNEENISEFKTEYDNNIEQRVTTKEVIEEITTEIGRKKAAVFVLHHQDFNNEDIADELYKSDITSRRITRQAVRGLLKSAQRKVKKHDRED